MNIRFAHNWNNKLQNKIFTTIRKYDSEKYKYYSDNLNKTFDVLLNDSHLCYSKLIHIQKIVLEDIPMGLLYADTGLIDPIKIFSNFGIKNGDDLVIILTFSNI